MAPSPSSRVQSLGTRLGPGRCLTALWAVRESPFSPLFYRAQPAIPPLSASRSQFHGPLPRVRVPDHAADGLRPIVRGDPCGYAGAVRGIAPGEGDSLMRGVEVGRRYGGIAAERHFVAVLIGFFSAALMSGGGAATGSIIKVNTRGNFPAPGPLSVERVSLDTGVPLD